MLPTSMGKLRATALKLADKIEGGFRPGTHYPWAEDGEPYAYDGGPIDIVAHLFAWSGATKRECIMSPSSDFEGWPEYWKWFDAAFPRKHEMLLAASNLHGTVPNNWEVVVAILREFGNSKASVSDYVWPSEKKKKQAGNVKVDKWKGDLKKPEEAKSAED